MHDDHDINRRFLKKKKKKKKIFRPTYPNFFGHVTGNTHTFLFGLMGDITLTSALLGRRHLSMAGGTPSH